MGKIRETTVEKLFGGRVLCRQHRHGYRFSHDPILLAHFFSPQPSERIIDLGTGCGIIPLILAYRWPTVSVTAFELQAQLAGLARSNFATNGMNDRLQVVEGDVCRIEDHFAPASFGRVVSNPPYRPVGDGRVNHDREQAIARHEISMALGDLVKAADWLLAEDGRLDLVYPFARKDDLFEILQGNGFSLVRLQSVHSYPGKEAGLILVEAVKGDRGELEELAPFYVHQRPGGEYTQEMALLYKP